MDKKSIKRQKEFVCDLSKTGKCPFAGNKYYNYGFVKGMANYCRFVRRFTADMKDCPHVKFRKQTYENLELLEREKNEGN